MVLEQCTGSLEKGAFQFALESEVSIKGIHRRYDPRVKEAGLNKSEVIIKEERSKSPMKFHKVYIKEEPFEEEIQLCHGLNLSEERSEKQIPSKFYMTQDLFEEGSYMKQEIVEKGSEHFNGINHHDVDINEEINKEQKTTCEVYIKQETLEEGPQHSNRNMPPLKLSIGTLARLPSQGSRFVATKANKTREQNEPRMTSQRSRFSASRTNETTVYREARLVSQKSNYPANRANETEERKSRLVYKRTRYAAAKKNKTTEQKEAKLASKRSRFAAARAKEKTKQREAILASKRSRFAAARANEKTKQREAILASKRSRFAATRAKGTIEYREASIASKRTTIYTITST